MEVVPRAHTSTQKEQPNEPAPATSVIRVQYGARTLRNPAKGVGAFAARFDIPRDIVEL